MADRVAEALKGEAAIRAGEQRVERAVVAAMRALAEVSMAALDATESMDASVLDTRWPEWQQIVDEVIAPVVADVYAKGYDSTTKALTAASLNAETNADQHLATVRNRMVGIGDEVFATITRSLAEGRADGEDIPTLANRVEKDLAAASTTSWKNRGKTVARTEVVGAYNAGARQSAVETAAVLGHDPDDAVKEWLGTLDNRIRPTHAEADGQQVLGMDTPFQVGGDLLQQPGDPAGSPEEVINCRCSALYHFPGDPGYPTDLEPTGPAGLPPERSFANEAPTFTGPDGATYSVNDDLAFGGPHWQSLTLEQQQTVIAYVGGPDYTKMKADFLAGVPNTRNDTLMGMMTNRMASDATLHRSMIVEQDFVDTLVAGSKIEHKFFISTSSDVTQAKSYLGGFGQNPTEIVLKILTPQGTRFAVGAGPMKELILHPASQMTVRTIRHLGPQKVEVVVDLRDG